MLCVVPLTVCDKVIAQLNNWKRVGACDPNTLIDNPCRFFSNHVYDCARFSVLRRTGGPGEYRP